MEHVATRKCRHERLFWNKRAASARFSVNTAYFHSTVGSGLLIPRSTERHEGFADRSSSWRELADPQVDVCQRFGMKRRGMHLVFGPEFDVEVLLRGYQHLVEGRGEGWRDL